MEEGLASLGEGLADLDECSGDTSTAGFGGAGGHRREAEGGGPSGTGP